MTHLFFANNNNEAKELKIHLTKYNISTKILPEAISWHFAGKFSHINQIKNIKKLKDLKESENNLLRHFLYQ